MYVYGACGKRGFMSIHSVLQCRRYFVRNVVAVDAAFCLGLI